MKKLILVLALVLLASPAFAGSVTFTVTDLTDGTVSKTYANFSDADITKWIAAYQSPCNSSINGTCARTQVLNYIVTQVALSWISATNAFNAQAAAATATAAVPTIIVAP